MKKNSVVLLVVVLISILQSCKTESEYNVSPTIRIGYPMVNLTSGDTLGLHYINNSSAGYYSLDTITIGDTIAINLVFNSYINTLKTIKIKQSSDSVSRVILPSKISMDSIFSSASNYENGNFVVAGSVNRLYFPIKFVATKMTNEAKFQILVESDASAKYSYSTLSIVTPIVYAK